MRIMAVDYGDARTGVAVSDMTRTITGDTLVIHLKNINEVASRIAGEALARAVSCIIIGMPKNMDGTTGAGAEKSRRLAQMLQELLSAYTGDGTLPVEIKLWDERLTTVSANKILAGSGKNNTRRNTKRSSKYNEKRKNTVDAVAASLILESYLASL